jgi:hypothetical protein
MTVVPFLSLLCLLKWVCLDSISHFSIS